jgi:glycosyltransferase 2 family protein
MSVLKRWQFWLGLVISLVFLYFALRGLGLKDLGVALQGANYFWLLPGIVVYFIAVWVRAWRWHYLVRPVKSVPTRRMFPIVAIGYMGNNIYPARAGEVFRAIFLKSQEGVAISTSLATIIVERIFDGVVMLGFVFVNLPELARLTANSGFVGSIQTVAIWGTGVFFGALLVFLLAAMFPKRAYSLVSSLVNRIAPQRFRQPFLGLVDKFLGGLEALRSPKDALMIFLTSVVIWLLETCKYWFVMHAFPFEVSFFALMLMNGIVNLATTIPSAPGYIGTFDAPGIAVLTAYNVAKATAAAYTLVLHVALWVPITALGLYYFLREGVKWKPELEKIEAER